MFRVFTFVSDEWQVTAELKPAITTTWSSQVNFHPNSHELVLAYKDEFVIENWSQKSRCSLSKRLPLQLMEVFLNDEISTWLEHYKPLRIQQINPQFTFGNVVISTNIEDELSVNGIDSKTPLEITHVATEEFNSSAKRLIGWYAGNQYLFCKLTNKSLYPIDFVTQKPNDSWVFIPYNSFLELQNMCTSAHELAAYLQVQALFFASLNSSVCAFDQKGTKQLVVHNGLLTRIDIHSNTFCKVSSLSHALDIDEQGSSDFLDYITKCVSANKHHGLLKLSSEELIVLLLYRDLICRTFDYVLHQSCLNLIYTGDDVLFAPVVWDQNNSNEYLAAFQWPIEYSHQGRPDYAAICAALSEYAEPTELLFRLTEAAENLSKINTTILADNPGAGKAVSHIYALSSIPQKLHQLELML